MTRLERRDLLKSVGAASVVATAGCLETSNGDADTESASLGDHRGTPRYVDYIPVNRVNGDNGGLVAYIDFEQTNIVEKERGPLDQQLADQRLEDDTLMRLSNTAITVSLFDPSARLRRYGFYDEFAEADFEEVDAILIIDAAIVLFGEFDTDDIVEMTMGFDHYGDHGDFEIYEGVDADSGDEERTAMADTDGLAYAVSEDAIVASIDHDIDGLDLVEEITAAATGDRDTIADSHDSVDWALGTAGHGEVVYAWWGIENLEEIIQEPISGQPLESQVSFLKDAKLVVSSLGVDSETVTGQFALQSDEAIDDEIEASLDEYVGQTADDRDRRTDDDRAFVSGSWEV